MILFDLNCKFLLILILVTNEKLPSQYLFYFKMITKYGK